MRRALSILVLSLMLSGLNPSPAMAIGDRNDIPVGLDVAVMRPVGIIATVGGVAAMVPVGLFTLMTRPTEIAKPWNAIVRGPARFTWVRPLGQSWGDRT